jgi:outer membrane protein OmpA-like peptidoglycan-associated protein
MRFIFFSVLIFNQVLLLAQSSKSARALKLYQEGAYYKALEIFETMDKSEKNYEEIVSMADCYKHLNKYLDAEKQYSLAVKYNNSKPIDKFHYAQVLQTNGKCMEAKKWYSIYSKLDLSDKRAVLLASSCDSIRFYRSDSSQYHIKRLHDLNSSDSDFGATVFKDGLVFTSARGGSKTTERDGSPYLNMYLVQFDESKQLESIDEFRGKVGSKFHDGPACFSKDFNEIYFTRNEKGNKGTMRLHIFKAKLKNEEWYDIEELPFNNDYYSVGHPSLSADGNLLYFTSDKGGFGGTDIFVSRRKGSSWSSPENLGSKINTRGNEMFPYISNDGVLYFASNGHAGLGGLDIYRATFDEFGNCTLIQNMGAPINSTFDDFALTLGKQSYTGYFSSNRPGGMGNDDIFEFQDLGQVNVSKIKITGKVTQKNASHQDVPVPRVTLSLYNEEEKIMNETITQSDGAYNFEVESEKNYTIVAKKDNYFTDRKKFSTVGKSASKGKTNSLDMNKLGVNIAVKEIRLNEENEIPHILWDYNDATLKYGSMVQLNKTVQLLKDNPNIVIEIGSHTDSRGDHGSNVTLSQKRADAVRNYLISKGIASKRITSMGYGEMKPIIKNATTEEEHAKNRRTEFSVIQILH